MICWWVFNNNNNMTPSQKKAAETFRRLYTKKYGFPAHITHDGEYFRMTGVPYGFDLKRLKTMTRQLMYRMGINSINDLD